MNILHFSPALNTCPEHLHGCQTFHRWGNANCNSLRFDSRNVNTIMITAVEPFLCGALWHVAMRVWHCWEHCSSDPWGQPALNDIAHTCDGNIAWAKHCYSVFEQQNNRWHVCQQSTEQWLLGHPHLTDSLTEHQQGQCCASTSLVLELTPDTDAFDDA